MSGLRAMTLVAAGALACGGGAELSPGFEKTLDAAGGCNDIYLLAADPADQRHLVFRAMDSPVAALRAGAASRVYDLGTSENQAVLFAEGGERVSAGFCNGTGSPSVESRYHAIAGTVTLTLDPGPEPDVLHLKTSGLVLHEEFGDDEFAISDLSFSYAVEW